MSIDPGNSLGRFGRMRRKCWSVSGSTRKRAGREFGSPEKYGIRRVICARQAITSPKATEVTHGSERRKSSSACVGWRGKGRVCSGVTRGEPVNEEGSWRRGEVEGVAAEADMSAGKESTKQASSCLKRGRTEKVEENARLSGKIG
jgi:hypothetical protein